MLANVSGFGSILTIPYIYHIYVTKWVKVPAVLCDSWSGQPLFVYQLTHVWSLYRPTLVCVPVTSCPLSIQQTNPCMCASYHIPIVHTDQPLYVCQLPHAWSLYRPTLVCVPVTSCTLSDTDQPLYVCQLPHAWSLYRPTLVCVPVILSLESIQTNPCTCCMCASYPMYGVHTDQPLYMLYVCQLSYAWSPYRPTLVHVVCVPVTPCLESIQTNPCTCCMCASCPMPVVHTDQPLYMLYVCQFILTNKNVPVYVSAFCDATLPCT